MRREIERGKGGDAPRARNREVAHRRRRIDGGGRASTCSNGGRPVRDRFRSGKRGAELGKAWSRCKGRRGGPGCAESEDGGRSWSGRRRRGRLCSARAQGRRREWKHGSSGIRSGGFVGDKNVRGTRMAGAWHEDGRRRWRRAARRDSCNARRSRAPGGPFGQEIWGRDTCLAIIAASK